MRRVFFLGEISMEYRTFSLTSVPDLFWWLHNNGHDDVLEARTVGELEKALRRLHKQPQHYARMYQVELSQLWQYAQATAAVMKARYLIDEIGADAQVPIYVWWVTVQSDAAGRLLRWMDEDALQDFDITLCARVERILVEQHGKRRA